MARSGRSVTGPHRSRTVRSRARPHGRSGLPQPGHASARRARATRAAAVSKTSIIVHPASLRGSRTPGKRQLVLHPGPRLAARATRPARPQPPAPHRHATAAAEPCGPPGPADPRGPARHRQGAAADQPASPAPLIGTVNAGNRQNRGNPSRRSTHAGNDITVIALWLGHESVTTTQIYLQADMALKQRALDRTTPLSSTPGRYKPPDQLLAFLEAL